MPSKLDGENKWYSLDQAVTSPQHINHEGNHQDDEEIQVLNISRLNNSKQHTDDEHNLPTHSHHPNAISSATISQSVLNRKGITSPFTLSNGNSAFIENNGIATTSSSIYGVTSVSPTSPFLLKRTPMFILLIVVIWIMCAYFLFSRLSPRKDKQPSVVIEHVPLETFKFIKPVDQQRFSPKSTIYTMNGTLEKRGVSFQSLSHPEMDEEDNKKLQSDLTSQFGTQDWIKEVAIGTGPFINITRERISKMAETQCTSTSEVDAGAIPVKKKLNRDWPKFSPSEKEVEAAGDGVEIASWIRDNYEEWQEFLKMENGEEFDKKKIKMNALVLTVNTHLKPAADHLPIWMKAFKRTDPLYKALNALCRVDDIEKTILDISIDGGGFEEIIKLLMTVKCVRIRIFFHPYYHSIKTLGMDDGKSSTPKTLNTHYAYGMYLHLKVMNYPYVITMEDDLEVSPDFYRYHFSLFHRIYKENRFGNRERIFCIAAQSHGPYHDCNFITTKITGTGECLLGDVQMLILEDYFPGWGSGVPASSFWEYWSVWKDFDSMVYDGIMWGLRNYGERRCVVPCSPRIRLLPNKGTHAGGEVLTWASYLASYAKWQVPPLKRRYEFIKQK